MPQISSGYSFGLGISVGSLSICHPSTPFLRACSTKMRQATSVFHTAKQESRAIRQQRRAGIEHTID